MRLKHVKGAGEKVKSSSYLIENPNEYKGKFKEVFNNDNPIYIEIGMGKGNFIYENAIKYPNINFIGIEKYDSVMVRAIEKVENEKISNLRFIRMDANEIENVFYKEIDRIYLNFSDPWPKKRHAKRRLSSPIFLAKYDNLFKGNKVIEMKTDNDDLFEYSVEMFLENGYSAEEIDTNHFADIRTEYEDKFISLGKNINYIRVVKE